MLPLRLNHPDKVTFAEMQDEYHAMDVVFENGEMISLWQPSEIERQTICNGGVIRLSIEGVRLPPSMVMAQSMDGSYLAPMSIMFIVWNADKSDCFATKDQDLANNVRKGAVLKCYNQDGSFNDLAEMFCNTYLDQFCTIQTIAC